MDSTTTTKEVYQKGVICKVAYKFEDGLCNQCCQELADHNHEGLAQCLQTKIAKMEQLVNSLVGANSLEAQIEATSVACNSLRAGNF